MGETCQHFLATLATYLLQDLVQDPTTPHSV